MNSISFKNRIALYYSITTAVLVLAVFLVILLIVRQGVYKDIDNDLQKEIDDLLTEITAGPAGFSVEQEEWHEKEHNTLDINPIFIQFADASGRILDRSPNLKKMQLRFGQPAENELFYNSTLDSIQVRQARMPVRYQGKTVGYIIVAAPLEDARSLIDNLEKTLLVAYPLLLLALFSIARVLAGGSIRPVRDIIDTARKISHEKLSDRIPYPRNRDELYTLSETINGLLGRIESAVVREKQFTSDASHELRTPLAVIKGTLEVLVRKPRSQEEFTEKIRYCVDELNRINQLVDQLLLLARFESQKQSIAIESTNINSLFLEVVARNSDALAEKDIRLEGNADPGLYIATDAYLLSIVLDNLLSNAIKYSGQGSAIRIASRLTENGAALEIADSGIGIAPQDLGKIYSPFYRSRPEDHAQTKGSGLGLSIVKRICEMLEVSISLESRLEVGTTVCLQFREITVQD